MKNHIRKLIAKIESENANAKISQVISANLAKKGIKTVRLSQLKGNHRQPNVTELRIIHKELKKHLPELEMDSIIQEEETAEA